MSFSAAVANFYSSVASQSELMFCVKISLPFLGSCKCSFLNTLKTFYAELQGCSDLIWIIICIFVCFLLKTKNFLVQDPCLHSFWSRTDIVLSSVTTADRWTKGPWIPKKCTMYSIVPKVLDQTIWNCNFSRSKRVNFRYFCTFQSNKSITVDVATQKCGWFSNLMY